MLLSIELYEITNFDMLKYKVFFKMYSKNIKRNYIRIIRSEVLYVKKDQAEWMPLLIINNPVIFAERLINIESKSKY